MYADHSFEALELILAQSQRAFFEYKQVSLKDRGHFMRMIAEEIDNVKDELVEVAHRETSLSATRLYGEIKRTIFQLTSYAAATEKGNWLEVRIDSGDNNATPPKADLRKMLVPLGPVVVFGASNFPFAYSTAGGDTACALAAGCPVIVKAHPAHAMTSTLVANAIAKAAVSTKMPKGVFAHVYGANFRIGEYLVKHDVVKAVGFTGSYKGGMALFNIANQRSNPIPVFAEMGSTNPVFLMPDKLKSDSNLLADQLTRSITQDMGQFCTNPGIVIAVKGEYLNQYKEKLVSNLKQVIPNKMLHEGIAESYSEHKKLAVTEDNVITLFESLEQAGSETGAITVAQVAAPDFIVNKQLHQEVFGPFSIMVICEDETEMLNVAEGLTGQLTCTLMATEIDLAKNKKLVQTLQEKCGRFILNNVPTGVEVALAMHHGGPFPSSTDSRFTAVGSDGIKRFARPLSFQNWDDRFLPDELKDENPLAIWRTINNELTK
jgi:alpha-ketoglutaric semialdehyde dehydrogenase